RAPARGAARGRASQEAAPPQAQAHRPGHPGIGMSPRAPVRAFVAFGANLGDPRAAFALACAQLAALPGTAVVARSSVYRSAPVGVEDQPDYINAVIALDTTLAPRALLEAL